MIKVGQPTAAIGWNEVVSTANINWNSFLLKYEVNKNKHNFHLRNNSEKIVYKKHDTSFLSYVHFSLLLFFLLFSFSLSVVRSGKFLYIAKQHDGKVFMSRTCMVIAHSWRIYLLNGSLVHREQLQKNSVWKGKKG